MPEPTERERCLAVMEAAWRKYPVLSVRDGMAAAFDAILPLILPEEPSEAVEAQVRDYALSLVAADIFATRRAELAARLPTAADSVT